MTENHYKFAPGSIPVQIIDGVPACPKCGLPMTEVDDGMWKCPDMVALEEQVTRGLIRLLDRKIAEMEATA